MENNLLKLWHEMLCHDIKKIILNYYYINYYSTTIDIKCCNKILYKQCVCGKISNYDFLVDIKNDKEKYHYICKICNKSHKIGKKYVYTQLYKYIDNVSFDTDDTGYDIRLDLQKIFNLEYLDLNYITPSEYPNFIITYLYILLNLHKIKYVYNYSNTQYDMILETLYKFLRPSPLDRFINFHKDHYIFIEKTHMLDERCIGITSNTLTDMLFTKTNMLFIKKIQKFT